MAEVSYIRLFRESPTEGEALTIAVKCQVIVIRKQEKVSLVAIPQRAAAMLEITRAPLSFRGKTGRDEKVSVISVATNELSDSKPGGKIIEFGEMPDPTQLASLLGAKVEAEDFSGQSDAASGFKSATSTGNAAVDLTSRLVKAKKGKAVRAKARSVVMETSSSEDSSSEENLGRTVDQQALGLQHLATLLGAPTNVASSSTRSVGGWPAALQSELTPPRKSVSSSPTDLLAAATSAGGNLDSNQLMNLTLLQKLEEMSLNAAKRNKKKALEDTSSESEEEQQKGLAASFTAYYQLQKRRLKKPQKIIDAFRVDVKERRLGVIPGHSWTYRQLWKEDHFSKCRSIGKASWILLEVRQQFEEGRPQAAWATAIHGWESLHQFALDAGSWHAAWPLSLLSDPFSRPEFASSENNLAVIAGLLKARTDLKTRVTRDWPSCRRTSGGDEEQVDEAEEARPKPDPKKKKQ